MLWTQLILLTKAAIATEGSGGVSIAELQNAEKTRAKVPGTGNAAWHEAFRLAFDFWTLAEIQPFLGLWVQMLSRSSDWLSHISSSSSREFLLVLCQKRDCGLSYPSVWFRAKPVQLPNIWI